MGSDPRLALRDCFQLLHVGFHEYTFQYRLPRKLPSSFELEDEQFKGRVHYMLRAKLDCHDNSDCVHKDQPFLVLAPLDLQHERNIQVSSNHVHVPVHHKKSLKWMKFYCIFLTIMYMCMYSQILILKAFQHSKL